MDVSCLTNPVTTVLCLCIHGWIPVRVVEDDSISPGQIHPQTTRARGENETEYTIITIEALQQHLQGWVEYSQLRVLLSNKGWSVMS